MKYGIIADDLTGSCDVAARLTPLGYRPLVNVRPTSELKDLATTAPAAVVWNTRSRNRDVEDAVARARAAAKRLERIGVSVFYHKIDSTLRGHWAEEMKAIARIARPEGVILCPAFPAQGRFVRDGCLEVRHRKNLESETLFKTDQEASLREMVRKRCRWPATEIHVRVVRRGPAEIRAALRTAGQTQCAIFDADSERDLQTIGRTFRRFQGRLLWVGSGGLAAHVFPPLSRPESIMAPARGHPWLLIQGSSHLLSQAQFRRLALVRGICTINFAPARSREQKRKWCREAAAALAVRRDVAVTVPEEFAAEMPHAFSRFLDVLLRVILREGELGGIFVAGGRTAEAVCDTLRLTRLRVIEEVRPGMAASVALDGRRPGLRLVTKAGGFGEANDVRNLLEEYARTRP